MQAPSVAPVPPPLLRNWTPRRVFLSTVSVVAVIVGFYLMYRFSNVLFVLFVGAVLATAMRPAVLWLERRRVPQWAGVLLIYLALALAVAGFFATLVPLLAEQGSRMVQEVPTFYQERREDLRGANSQLLRRIGNNLPEQLDFSLVAGTTRQQAEATGNQESVVSQGVGYLASFSWSLFSFVAVFLIGYFWTLDRDQIVRAGLLIVPIDSRAAAQGLWDSAEQKVGGYVRGQALLMLSIGVLSGIAFFAIGAPSALIMAVLAGVLEAVPYVGPLIAVVVAALIALAEAPDKLWWVIGASLVIQQIENSILVPRIMGRAVGVNAIVTLLGIAAFGSLLGVGGALLAIPLSAIVQVFLDHWVLHRDAQPLASIDGRDRTALVRYQAQDLAQDLRERIRARPSSGDDDEDSFEEQIEAVVGDIDQILVQVSTPAAPQTVSAPAGGTF